ncbi:MAG: hypothetical protein KDI19_01325 [Pseudomonadales bacterium]|nr:hypothetical protein [Pseudomonadales bacterium]
MSFFVHYQYVIAWAVYLLAGMGCCVVWWKMTSIIGNRAVREMLRGFAIVLIFTPWYAGDTPEFYAPAVVVLLMDVLLAGTASGLKGGVVLLFTTFSMLVVLTVRQFRRYRG